MYKMDVLIAEYFEQNDKSIQADLGPVKMVDTQFRRNAPSNVEALKCTITSIDTKLVLQPVTYIICVHIRNIRAANCSDALITRHINNLEITYGETTVRDCITMFFPTFAAKYYGAI